MHNVIPWATRINTLAQQWCLARPQGSRTHRYVKFFEVDVKQMFPRLRRRNPNVPLDTVMDCDLNTIGVWEAIVLVTRWVAKAHRVRWSGQGFWFGIHENKHMDIMRKAYGDQYQNLSWSDIFPYLRFELFANCFVLGSRVFRQLLGVAIGVMLSAQLATLYYMDCEHIWAMQHDFRMPWSKTSPTPGPQRFLVNLKQGP